MSRWEPAAELGLDVGAIREAVARAAGLGEPWLRHPCMSRLTKAEPPAAYRDLVLAAWTAANTHDGLGDARVSHPMVLWSGAGDVQVEVGRHDLASLGARMAEPPPIPLSLDLWCRSTGVAPAGSWAALPVSELAHREPELRASIGGFLRTMALLAQRCPDVVQWITSATRVVRPLVPVAGVARSSHDPDVAGLVEADVSRGATQTIELVVHETAHLHLRAAEAAGPLVDPGHAGTYASPLRPEPRPLVGIVLAYHALAYICAALAAATATEVVDADVAGPAITDLVRRRDEARAVLDGASRHLTDHGAAFLRRTHQVAGDA